MSPLGPDGASPRTDPGSVTRGGAGRTGATAEVGADATGGAPAGDTGPATDGRRGPAHHRRSSRRWLVEWGVVIVVALLVAFLVRTYVAQTFYVPSTSMYPTLKAGDRIVVDKLAFDFGSVSPGDIIVFKRPPREDCGGPPVPDLVKRVVGLPGQTIEARNDTVFVTGRVLPEPWLPHGASTFTSNFGPVKIPANQYFVMGDNRVASCDSRMWGTVERSYIVGKVDFIIWPLSQLRFF